MQPVETKLSVRKNDSAKKTLCRPTHYLHFIRLQIYEFKIDIHPQFGLDEKQAS